MTSNVLEMPENLAAGAAVEEACGLIPPLWPMQSFVAVNPFLGASGEPFRTTVREWETRAGSPMLPTATECLDFLQRGEITAEAIRQVRAGRVPLDPVRWLEERLRQPVQAESVSTLAEWLVSQGDARDWPGFITGEIGKWCAAWFDRGQSGWPMPWRDLPLYQAWREAAAHDANPEMFGLPGFRRFISQLPLRSEEAIEECLGMLAVPEEHAVRFLHRQLLTVFGWSARAAQLDWPGEDRPTVRQLLAIRLAYDAALRQLAPAWPGGVAMAPLAGGNPEARAVALAALEQTYRLRLARNLRANSTKPARTGRARLQAIFCIDVRSEVYRRHLEAQSGEIETIGFAGFFGMAVAADGEARCPVLLQPAHHVRCKHEAPGTLGRWAEAGKQLLSSATGCFPAVEVAGLGFAAGLVARWLPRKSAHAGHPAPLEWNISLAERVDLAAGALKNMSLVPEELAPVVLVCGHGSATENNPYGASLDCGACGGHAGDVNARLACAILNDPEVRTRLAARGMAIPADTRFVAALHVTTTDEVRLLEPETLGVAARTELEAWLAAAGREARRERHGAEGTERAARRRSADWSEVRPEWGLAGNAAFLAGPRSRTRGVELEGRTFLHDYDWRLDTDGSVLRLILTAPVVVASWINLQYYGSRVNPRLFGSGNKVLHDVVGTSGIWEGEAGDLRTGLPLQSLHDGERWRHDPLRLLVVVDAPPDRIARVLRENASIRNLVENEWIRLESWDEWLANAAD